MKLLGFKLHRWNFLVAQFATVKYSEQIQTTIAFNGCTTECQAFMHGILSGKYHSRKDYEGMGCLLDEKPVPSHSLISTITVTSSLSTSERFTRPDKGESERKGKVGFL